MFPSLGISDEPAPADSKMDKRDLLYILLFFATAAMAAWVLHAIALVN